MGQIRVIPVIFVLILLSFVGTTAQAESATVTFVAPHFHEELTLFGLDPRGRVLPRELNLLSQLLRCRRTGRRHPIHPNLAKHIVGVARHFRRPVTVVSGYRAVPIRGHKRSFHLRGMAVDIHVPGVPAIDVRDYAVSRDIGGIGFYPKSGFVHLDVRERRFWWVDYSRPGQIDRLIPDPDGTAPPEPIRTADALTKNAHKTKNEGLRAHQR